MGVPVFVVTYSVPREWVYEGSPFTFRATGEGGTELTVTEHGYTTEEARDLSRAGMEQCLDKMAAIFAGP